MGWILSQSDSERDTILNAEETQQMAQIQVRDSAGWLGPGIAAPSQGPLRL